MKYKMYNINKLKEKIAVRPIITDKIYADYESLHLVYTFKTKEEYLLFKEVFDYD